MIKKRHQLRLIGITYNQIESGVYAVILEEIGGNRRIPIVIGYPEAQAIECKLQEIRTPRPLTHDLMKCMMEQFDIRLSCVDIRRLDSGVFAADLVMESPDGELRKIDARSSDAIALAIRCDAPIYTTADVLEESGFRPRDIKNTKEVEDEISEEVIPASSNPIESFDNIEEFIASDLSPEEESERELMEFLSNFSDKEIEMQIARFAAEEKYEVAARLKAMLQKRKNGAD